MPPTFRSSRSGRQFNDGVNRTRTGQIDHDVFEGLPIRRWARQVQTISQEPKTERAESEAPGHGGKQAIPEHPMPRDSHLLSPMSRALLRAARSGCIYIRQASKDFDDEEKEATDPEEQQTQQNLERNFAMRKWTTVPKHLEAPEVEFLAKRRPGLPSLYGATAGIVDGANGAVPMRKTRFKKVDPVTGNISIYAAWVPEGHKIEGEITDDAQLVTENNQVTVTPEAPAPGTVIEGVGVVNAQGVVVAEAGSAAVLTPPRRRPPPPKRKAKGLKGRRKKVMFAPGDGADASLVHGTGAGDSAANYGKETDPSRMSVDQTTQDDEDDEGEEGEESDDGEGDESGVDAKTPETPGPQPSTEPEPEPTLGPGTESTSTPVPVKAETPIESQALQAPQAQKPETERESEPAVESQTPAHPATPSPGNIPVTPANLTSSASPDQPTETTSVAPMTEDVQMSDSMPTEDAAPPSPLPASETQPQATRDSAQPESTEKSQSPHQGTQRPLDPESSNVAAENAKPLSSEQSGEPMDVTMTEADESDPQHPQVEPVSMDISTEAPQPSLADQAPENDSTPQQPAQQPGGTGFDLLDNLEASLNNVPKDMPSNEQTETNPEKSDVTSQEGASEPEPAVPVQPPTEVPVQPKPAEATAETKESTPEEPTAPPVEQLTPPEVEQTIIPETTEEHPTEQQAPPSTEPHRPEHVPEAHTHTEPLPSSEPATEIEIAQPTTEQPEQKPQKPVPEQASSEPTAVPVTAEPQAAQEPRHDSFSEPPAEQQVDAKATPAAAEQEQEQEQEQQTVARSEASAQPTAEPVEEAAAEPAAEPAPESAPEQPQPIAPGELHQPQAEPVSTSTIEPAVEPQHEETQTGAVEEGQGTSGDGPSSNGEQQSQ